MGRVQDKVALVTGAEGGIGFASAVLLAKEGAKVIATDLSLENLEKNYKEESENIELFSLDVTDEAQWTEVMDKVIEKYGKIDILVNNAGIHQGTDLVETDIETLNNVMNVNVNGVYLGMRSVVPYMRKNGQGSIVNIASLASLLGGIGSNGGSHAYGASKGAVLSLSRSAAQEYAKDKIRVNTIHPGPIFTPIMEKAGFTLEKAQEVYGSNIPLPPYVGEPKDIAYGVLYLASEESRYVTAEELVIDGGFAVQ